MKAEKYKRDFLSCCILAENCFNTIKAFQKLSFISCLFKQLFFEKKHVSTHTTIQKFSQKHPRILLHFLSCQKKKLATSCKAACRLNFLPKRNCLELLLQRCHVLCVLNQKATERKRDSFWLTLWRRSAFNWLLHYILSGSRKSFVDKRKVKKKKTESFKFGTCNCFWVQLCFGVLSNRWLICHEIQI